MGLCKTAQTHVCDIECGMIFLSCSFETLNSHGWPFFIYSDCGPADRAQGGGLDGLEFKSPAATFSIYVMYSL